MTIAKGMIVHVRNPLGAWYNGRAMRGDHYAVVISTPCPGACVLTIAWLTSNMSRASDSRSGGVVIGPYTLQRSGGHDQYGVVLTRQITTVDIEEVTDVVAMATKEEMSRIDSAIKDALGLTA